jgi:hypothetical protein
MAGDVLAAAAEDAPIIDRDEDIVRPIAVEVLEESK